MKKIFTYLGTILFLVAVGLTTPVARTLSAIPLSAVPPATPEKPLVKAAAVALVAELTIGEREVDGVTILDLEGKITEGGGTAALRKAIRGSLDQGQKKILLNFAGVSNVDVSGIGEMIASHKATKAQGGQLKMCKFSQSLLDELAITKLIGVFDVYDNEQEALDTFI